MDLVGKIKVTVHAPEGEPLPEAFVELVEGPSAPLEHSTDDQGFCTFLTVVPGSYRVEASMPGFTAATATTKVSGDQETTLDFRLSRAEDGEPG